MKKENEVSCLFVHNIISNGLIKAKKTTELVLLFRKKTTKLVFLWHNISQKYLKMLKAENILSYLTYLHYRNVLNVSYHIIKTDINI